MKRVINALLIIAAATPVLASHQAAATSVSTSTECKPEITNIEIWDAENDSFVTTLRSSYDVSETNNLQTIVVKANDCTESIYYKLNQNGAVSEHTENEVPYSISGDKDGDLHPWDFPSNGNYTLTVQPFSKNKLTGEKGESITLDFTIAGICEPDVLNLYAQNTDTNTRWKTLHDGQRVDVTEPDTPPRFALVADTNECAQSAKIEVLGVSNQTENIRPFTQFGDSDGTINPWLNFEPKSYEITVTAYAEKQARGYSNTRKYNVTWEGCVPDVAITNELKDMCEIMHTSKPVSVRFEDGALFKHRVEWKTPLHEELSVKLVQTWNGNSFTYGPFNTGSQSYLIDSPTNHRKYYYAIALCNKNKPASCGPSGEASSIYQGESRNENMPIVIDTTEEGSASLSGVAQNRLLWNKKEGRTTRHGQTIHVAFDFDERYRLRNYLNRDYFLSQMPDYVTMSGLKKNESEAWRSTDVGPFGNSRVISECLYMQIQSYSCLNSLRQYILFIANTWSENANVKFAWAGKNHSPDIIVAFDRNAGAHVDEIGWQAKILTRDGKPSMNLGFSGKGTILHEFGHALGLLHEHQREGYKIDYERTLDYYKWKDGWSENVTKHNVIRKIDEGSSAYTVTADYDSQSIMQYFQNTYNLDYKWLEENWDACPSLVDNFDDRAKHLDCKDKIRTFREKEGTDNPKITELLKYHGDDFEECLHIKCVPVNSELSPSDKKLIRKLYPFVENRNDLLPPKVSFSAREETIGTYVDWVFCPVGTFATGIEVKSENYSINYLSRIPYTELNYQDMRWPWLWMLAPRDLEKTRLSDNLYQHWDLDNTGITSVALTCSHPEDSIFSDPRQPTRAVPTNMPGLDDGADKAIYMMSGDLLAEDFEKADEELPRAVNFMSGQAVSGGLFPRCAGRVDNPQQHDTALSSITVRLNTNLEGDKIGMGEIEGFCTSIEKFEATLAGNNFSSFNINGNGDKPSGGFYKTSSCSNETRICGVTLKVDSANSRPDGSSSADFQGVTDLQVACCPI